MEDHLSINSSNIQHKTIYKNHCIVNTLATIAPQTLKKIQTQSELDALLRYNKPSTRV